MSDTAGPGVRWPPPVVVGGLVVAAWLLGWVLPLRLGPPAAALGNAVLFAAIALVGWSLLVLVRAGNDPRPNRPDTAIVQGGPFRFSRNPIYLGFVLAAAGFALRDGLLWGWLAVGLAFLWLDRQVVAREEAYLAGRFGTAYAAYRARVRRWV